jgi:hypothetical protein
MSHGVAGRSLTGIMISSKNREVRSCLRRALELGTRIDLIGWKLSLRHHINPPTVLRK